MVSQREQLQETDFARSLLLDPKVLDAEIVASEEGLESPDEPLLNGRPHGVSVVIASANGVARIPAALESLARQTLSPECFEIIVVANGVNDGTETALQEFGQKYPWLNLKWYHRMIASAGGARNLGVQAAAYSFVTFLDDDDELEPHYLEVAFRHLQEDAIVICPIIDVEDGVRNESNTLNSRIVALPFSSRVVDIPWILGFNACKIFPSSIAKGLRYREDLRSGEDVVYFANLLGLPELKVIKPVSDAHCAYLRHLRLGTVSRQRRSYEFNVLERLDVIQALELIDVPVSALSSLRALKDAQRGFVNRYVGENRGQVDRLEHDLGIRHIADFDWGEINRGVARDLAIAYCFAPYSDTSAVVAAKAIAERGRVVDVISNSMKGVRREDKAVSALCSKWIENHFEMNAPPSFAGWSAISDFAVKALEVAEGQGALNGGYGTMYTRALWVGSHVAGALYKLRHWPTVWTAEFSDPLRYDATGEKRVGALGENAVTERLKRALSSRGFDYLEIDSVFDLVEASTFVLADELIFTNSNQLEYMLDDYPEAMRAMVRKKAIVRPHPTPHEAAYEVSPTSLVLPRNVVNVGYFGSFYANRGLGSVLTALANMSQESRRGIRLHLFCNQSDQVQNEVNASGAAANVYVRGYLPYMEFLNASRTFDVLIVNDVARGVEMRINPFLPSKYSDYSGAKTDIWSVCDEGSPLSGLPSRYRCSVEDPLGARAVLGDILADHCRL